MAEDEQFEMIVTFTSWITKMKAHFICNGAVNDLKFNPQIQKLKPASRSCKTT